jgi:acyl-CoA synthetase (AMP-forming)/AMP-acid ligase II
MHDLQGRVKQTLATRPEAVLLEFEGSEWRRAAFARLADKLESRLATRLVSPHSVVALLIRNRPMHIGALWALIAAGRTVAFLNPFQDARQIAAEIAAQRFEALIADRQDWASAAIREAADAAGTLGIALGAEPEDSAEWIEGQNLAVGATHRAPLPGVAVEMLSGGTSGTPKRIPLSYRALGFSIHECDMMNRQMGEDANFEALSATLILYGPAVHLGGLFTTLQSGVEGRRLAMLEKLDVPSWRELVKRYRPTLLGLPPAQMRMVLDADVPLAELSAARAARSGNAMLDEETRDRFERRYGIPVLSVYGATEYCGPIASWTLADHERYGLAKRGSVGRLWPHIATGRILDPGGGGELAVGEVGVLSVRIPTMSDGWITTNDLAKLDSDGFLYLMGRADDAINRGGFKVHPSVIEDALRRHPAVVDTIVIGIPDRRLGSVPVAAVELAAAAESVGSDELRAWLKERLVAYQVPVQIRVGALPRTPALKISREGVRKLFSEEQPASRKE